MFTIHQEGRLLTLVRFYTVHLEAIEISITKITMLRLLAIPIEMIPKHATGN